MEKSKSICSIRSNSPRPRARAKPTIGSIVLFFVVYANQKCRLRKQFARIHNVIWIKVLFDAFHQGNFRGRADSGQPLFFDDTYAVFGGNRAVAGKDVAIDCAVDVVFVTVNFIAEDFGRESIVVQAAVAQMSEADDLYAF